MRQLVTKTAVALAIVIGAALSALPASTSSDGKAPLTTNSESALENYKKGRGLIENLRAIEARPFLQKAIEEDPNFAVAHLLLAQAQPTNKLFTESLNKATSLADQVSEAEYNWILGFEAGTIDADPEKQRVFFAAIVKAYPNDERARNLLGTNYFVQQEWGKAIAEYKRAIKIDPEYAGVYNLMGYAYRSLEEFDKAEKIFKKYTELIPDDPNPYDSYAELLMKIGRYVESIEQYQKALDMNPKFVFSHAGIASNYNFLGKHDKAREQLTKMYDGAQNDFQRRFSLTAMGNSYTDEGKFDLAVAQFDKCYMMDKAAGDTAAMSTDLVLRAYTIIETPGGGQEALENFKSSLALIESSSVSEKLKTQTRIGFLFNSGRAYEVIGDLENANKNVTAYLKQATEKQNKNQIKAAHHLAGRIALQEGQYDLALKELLQSNLQNPNHLYFIGKAYEGKGVLDKAKEFYDKVANFNGLNNGLLASVRVKATEKVKSLSL